MCAMLFTLSLNAQTFTANREKFVKEFQASLTEFGKGEFHDFAKKNATTNVTGIKRVSRSLFHKDGRNV
jgi:hypothetical protein